MNDAATQLQLGLPAAKAGRGGARTNAGRKKGRGGHDSPHRERERITRHVPVHVVLRTVKAVGRLRRGVIYQALRRAFSKVLDRGGMRVVHVSIQHNHVHLLVEAASTAELAAGMQALGIMAARAINRVQARTGKVFAYRYHATPIRSPRQARNTLAYVLNNWRRHHEDEPVGGDRPPRIDPFSTARDFTGWREGAPLAPPELEPLPHSAAESWLLTVGWASHGAVSVYEVPAR